MMVKTCFYNVFWHLISYNSFRNVEMYLLEVAICEKCRSSHFQSEGAVKSLRTGGLVKKFEDWRGLLIWERGLVPHYMPCDA